MKEEPSISQGGPKGRTDRRAADADGDDDEMIQKKAGKFGHIIIHVEDATRLYLAVAQPWERLIRLQIDTRHESCERN